MKKKIRFLSLLLCMILLSAGCGNSTSEQGMPEQEMPEQEMPEQEMSDVPETEETISIEPAASEQETQNTDSKRYDEVEAEVPQEVKAEVSKDEQHLPPVYFTADISPEGLAAVYEALGRKAEGENVAVKLHTGEGTESNYLRPEFIKDMIFALLTGLLVNLI